MEHLPPAIDRAGPVRVNIERVPLISKLAFGAGDFGPAVATAIMSFFLLYFLTDVAGLSAGSAGLILLISKIWDAFNDPLIGFLSDRTQSRWGRRRPWFLFGAVPFALTYVLLWLVPGFGTTGKFLYYLFALLLFDTAFSIVNVPYTTLTAEMTRSYDERTSLTAYRFAFSIGGSLLAATSHQALVALGADERQGYLISAAVWGVLVIVPFLFAFWKTYERHQVTDGAELGFVAGLRVTLRNKAFQSAIVIYLLSWFVVQSVSMLIIYYCEHWLRRPDLTTAVILGVQGSAFLWLGVWNLLSRRLSKQIVYYLGMTCWVAVSFGLFLMPQDAPSGAIIGLAALAGAGVAAAYLVPWALLPDVIELDELQTGQRREGAFYGLFVLIQKLGLGLGLFLVGQVLEISGYVAQSTAPQPASVLTAIRWMIGPIPALVLVLSIVMVARFPISRQQHAAILAQIAERAKQQEHPHG